MSIESRHPDYVAKEDEWRTTRDSFAGEQAIKAASTLYLPMTSGQREDGAAASITTAGFAAYSAYKARAVFPEFVRDAVEVLTGVMHSKPPVIELPPQLEEMRNLATRKGESLEMLLRRINEQQLVFGRIGLLADSALDRDVPHLVFYNAESIINWDDERMEEFGLNELNFLVLQENVVVRGTEGADIFDWMNERRFRVAFLEGSELSDDLEPTGDLVYKTFNENDDVRGVVVVPSIAGRTLDEIPFVVIGANDLCFTPDDIPLLGLAQLALTVYRGEADYRQSLFMQGQDTLVVVGEDPGEGDDGKGARRIGAGAEIVLPDGGEAMFIGVESDGLPEQRRAIQNDRADAIQKGARLLEPVGTQAESGEALKIRVGAQTANLRQIALTGAAGLQEILRICARWVGADEEAVIVRPNFDFADAVEKAAGARDLAQAKKEGFPISDRSIHAWSKRQGFTELEFEDEQKLLDEEQAKKDERAMKLAAAGVTPLGEEDNETTPADEEEDASGEE